MRRRNGKMQKIENRKRHCKKGRRKKFAIRNQKSEARLDGEAALLVAGGWELVVTCYLLMAESRFWKCNHSPENMTPTPISTSPPTSQRDTEQDQGMGHEIPIGNNGNAGVLTLAKLRKLQELDNNARISIISSIRKYFNNDLHTDFEKTILHMKPSDCSMIEKYSQIESFPIQGRSHLSEITLATMYSDHPLREFHKRSLKELEEGDVKGLQNAKEHLRKIETLPVVVFIHGLGGQMSQFEPLMQEFRNCADIFSFDLPGFGNSKRPSRNDVNKGLHYEMLSNYPQEALDKLELCLDDMRDEDFETDSIVDMLAQILEQRFPNRRFIFISHSMGTHITTKLINRLSCNKSEALIMLAPPNIIKDSGYFPEKSKMNQMINRIPWSQRLFLQACTYFPRIFDYFRCFDRLGGLYSKSVESYLYCADDEHDDILKRLTQFRWNLDTDSSIFLKYLMGFRCATELELDDMLLNLNTGKVMLCCGELDKVTPSSYSDNIAQLIRKHQLGWKRRFPKLDLKYEIIPKANHSLFLDKPELLAGSVYKFVEDLQLNISCTWVLQVKAVISGDKWGLKNAAKWNKVKTISDPIINETSPQKPTSYLLGMKTLRQTDKVHNPITFEKQHPEIYAIIDIGSDTPSYDPTDFQRIKYVKYKTESKVTPDNISIVKFIEIVDKLIKERENDKQYIVVHCHYGQNRTGFLICCYLIEKLGWSVNEAIRAFQVSKEPGIKHVHFQNALHLRYNQ
jgi:pimeloyl-ACP methyl ester carboxylesterase